MARTMEVVPPEDRPRRRGRPTLRRTRVVVKRVGPWSVLRFSLLFYFCVMLVVLTGLTILYNILAALGVTDSVAKFVGDITNHRNNYHFHGWWLFTRAFAAGLVMVVFWSLVKLVVSFMYNLISDLVGGLEVTLTERR